jgi:hypothetical protein
MKKSLMLFLFLFTCAFAFENSPEISRDSIIDLLVTMVHEDQELRQKLICEKPDVQLYAQIKETNKRHIELLKSIMSKFGWITISQFGHEASDNTWLLVQHADDDVPLQKEVLALFEELIVRKEVTLQAYAYLYDRVSINEKRPQRFGTQADVIDHSIIFLPIEDPENIDERRAAYGLKSLEEYKSDLSNFFAR